MKNSAFVVSALFLTSLILFTNSPTYAMDEVQNSEKVELLAKAKPMNNSKKPPAKLKKAKNTKSSSGRCKNPDDLDASGKRCGKRAASAKPGGN